MEAIRANGTRQQAAQLRPARQDTHIRGAPTSLANCLRRRRCFVSIGARPASQPVSKTQVLAPTARGRGGVASGEWLQPAVAGCNSCVPAPAAPTTNVRHSSGLESARSRKLGRQWAAAPARCKTWPTNACCCSLGAAIAHPARLGPCHRARAWRRMAVGAPPPFAPACSARQCVRSCLRRPPSVPLPSRQPATLAAPPAAAPPPDELAGSPASLSDTVGALTCCGNGIEAARFCPCICCCCSTIVSRRSSPSAPPHLAHCSMLTSDGSGWLDTLPRRQSAPRATPFWLSNINYTHVPTY